VVSPQPSPSSPPGTTVPSAAASGTALGPTHTAPDLSKRPLTWFAPLPPQKGGPYDGSDDWSDLWKAGPDWDQLAAKLDIFKFYGGWVFAESSTPEIERARTTLDGFNLGLAVETSPLIPTAECGRDDSGNIVEGFAGEQARDTMENIRKAGGTVDLITLDEPWFYAHVYDGPGACHWPNDRIATGVADFIKVVREYFPNVVVGDIEPMPSPVTAAGLGDWLDAWQQAVGAPAPFLHVDPDWGRTDWAGLVGDIGKEAHARNVPFGFITLGDYTDQSDLTWLHKSGVRLNRLREIAGVEPDHVIFQSWTDHPDRALPEADPTTYTGWLLAYLADPHSVAAIGPTNFAATAKVAASSEVNAWPATNAIDGTDAHWNASEPAPGYIQLRLAKAATIARFVLTVAQDPAGQSTHELWVRHVGGKLTRIHVFSGVTKEQQILTYEPATPLSDIDVVRVVTTKLAGGLWPAWHEIELLGPG
jgi:hypothetical protein